MSALKKYFGPQHQLSRLRDLNRLLSPFDIRYDLDMPEVNEWTPSVDVKENDKEFVIQADLPGIKIDDIDVSMENNLLTIKGHRETESKEEKENFLRIERSRGSFMRQLSLPDTVDPDKIDAGYKNGVLQVILPKKAHSAARKIKVK